MDREKAKLMRAYLEASMTGFEEHFNIHVNIGNISYNAAGHAKITLHVADVNKDGTVSSKIAEDFRLFCGRYDLTPDLIGKEFSSRGQPFRLDGLNTRARKYPFVATRLSDGQSFKFPAYTIKTAFGVSV